MTRSPNPKASRTIQAKATRQRANERIADAGRALATKWATRTITEGDLIAFFAIVERAGKTPALTPCAGAGAGKENGLGSNPHRLPAERGGNEALGRHEKPPVRHETRPGRESG